jgi:hypothetical protein
MTDRQANLDLFSSQLQETGVVNTSFLPNQEVELASQLLVAARQIGASTVRIVVNFERAGTGRITCLIDGATA